MIRYISLCSGIEAFSCAVRDMPAYQPTAFSEIEPFPCKVLQHHYPLVPNLGDMTKIDGSIYHGAIQLVVGGTPCQGFSVAGKRGGLDDPRSGLALKYVELVSAIRPQWVLWENVPGALSTNGGRDFGTFVKALDDIGYGLAWRILDAQYFGVPQRRRRIFIVGYLGDYRPAAAVLFERESLSGDTKTGRKTGKEVAKCLTTGIGTRLDSETDTFAITSIGQYAQTDVAGTLRSAGGDNGGGSENVVTFYLPKVSGTLEARDYKGADNSAGFLDKLVCGTLNASGAGTSRPAGQSNELDFCIPANTQIVTPLQETADCLTSSYGRNWNGNASAENGSLFAKTGMNVRRLTPMECERLQGFPDGYTDIPGASDTGRYKALGNSMCVNVIRWIAQRMLAVDNQISGTH